MDVAEQGSQGGLDAQLTQFLTDLYAYARRNQTLEAHNRRTIWLGGLIAHKHLIKPDIFDLRN